MTPESPVIAELRGLLDALCEESITPEQLRRLEELVLAHPEAEAYYVQYMSFYADLVRNVAGQPGRAEQSVREKAGDAPPAPAPVAPATPATRSGGGFRRTRLLVLGAVGIASLAAGVILAVNVWLRFPQPLDLRPPEARVEATDDSVAVLLYTNRAQWEETGLPTRPGAPLPPGRLVLKSGFAQIEFYSGATVILEGPVEFRLVSRMEAYCAHGKLRATVPQHAQGFRIGSPGLNLVDRGTEFGLDVGGGKTAVHVFQGKVDLYDPGADATPRKELTTGQGVSLDAPGVLNPIDPNPRAFLTAGQLAERAAKDTIQRQQEWEKASKELRQDPSLVVYYSFEGADPLSRSLRDVSRGRQDPHDGTIVGSGWGNGRWNGRKALEFKRVSDRIRLHVPGDFQSLTLAAWVRPDALPNVNNSLLMSDGWEEGECHWQIGSDGTLILGIRGPEGYQPAPNIRGPQYRAHGAITPERFGRWVHLAVTYDRERGEVIHYVDGKPVAQSEILLDLPLVIGDAELGNWTLTGFKSKSPIRNFTGGMDEFLLFKRALTGEEIERLYTQGRPPL